MTSLTMMPSTRIKMEPVSEEDYGTDAIGFVASGNESLGREIVNVSPSTRDQTGGPPNKKRTLSHSSLDNLSTTLCNKYQNSQTLSENSINDSSSCRSTPTAATAPLSPKERSPYKHYEVTHSDHILKVMDEMRITGKFVDLILIAEDKEIPCHKVVICAVSQYFAQMIDLALPEIQHHAVVDITFQILSELIKFAYSSRITITDSNIQQILSASMYLKMSAVTSACVCFIKRKINPSNCVVLKKFAVSQKCTELIDFAQSYTLKNFTKVAQTQEFCEISLEDLLSYISSDHLNVLHEELVYSAVISWVRHNAEERKSLLPIALQNVRLPLIKPQYLLDVVQKDQLIRSSKECEPLLDEARRFQLLADQRPLMQSSRTQPRISYRDQVSEILVVVGGLNKDKILVPDCFYYSFPNVSGRSLAKLKVSQTAYSVATVNNNIFVTGGAAKSSCNEVWAYVPSLDVWQQVASFSEARYLHTSIGLGNHLYVVGGHNGTNRLDSVERYNPDSNTWVMVRPMLQPLSSPTAVTCDGCLYVIGGAGGPSPNEIVSSVQCYDPSTDSWVLLEPLPQPERGAVAANLNGIIYVLGQHRRVYAYNKHLNQWKAMNNTNGGHLHGAATVHRGKLYIAGGLHGNNYINGTIEVYDQLSDTWTVVSILNTPVYAQGFVSIFKDIR